MQTLDVISINIWDILVSLLNLIILFFIVKRFLYKPAKKILDNRDKAISDAYNNAEAAKNEAEEFKILYEQKLRSAEIEAEEIITSASKDASMREKQLIEEAKVKAEGILTRAKEDAELEKKKAEATVKTEIASVSSLIAEKILEREINSDDHKRLVDSFIESLGEEDA